MARIKASSCPRFDERDRRFYQWQRHYLPWWKIEGISKETWLYSTETGTWEAVSAPQGSPEIYFHTVVEGSRCSWIFGGIGPCGTIGDLYFVSSINIEMVGELSWVEKLPDDVLTHILSFLSSFELGRVGRVSQRMRLFSSSNLLWQNHITVLLNGVDWHSLTSSPTLLSASTAIRDYYYFLKRQSSFYRTGVFTHKKKLIQSLSSSKRNGQETELKICTLGCMGVGKSTILIQFMCGHL